MCLPRMLIKLPKVKLQVLHLKVITTKELEFLLWRNVLGGVCGARTRASAPARHSGLADPALLLLWHRRQCWLVFHPSPGNFHMPWVWQKKNFWLNLKRQPNFSFFLFSFLLFKAIPAVYRTSQARGQIGAAAASLCHIHNNAGSQPCL